MAKFCGNCGSQMDDNAVVCGYCGAPLGGNPAGNGNPFTGGFRIDDPEKKEKIKKYSILGGSALAAIVVIVIVIVSIVNNTGYKGAVKDVMKAYTDDNPEKLVELSCDFLKEDGDEVLRSTYKDILAYDIDDFERRFNGDYKISYDVDYSDLSDRQKEELLGEDDANEVEDVIKAYVKITARKGTKNTKKSRVVYVAKENGKWKLYRITG